LAPLQEDPTTNVPYLVRLDGHNSKRIAVPWDGSGAIAGEVATSSNLPSFRPIITAAEHSAPVTAAGLL